MAIVAKSLSIMATGAIDILASGVKPVSKCIIQGVDIGGQIVASVTVETKRFLPVALLTPFTVTGGSFTMLVPPVQRMDISQVYPAAVAYSAIPGSANTVMTIKADLHGRHKFFR